MSWTEKDRLAFADYFESQYGKRLSINDEMLPLLHYMFKVNQSTVSRLAKTEKILENTQKIVNDVVLKANPKTYHFSSGEAFRWQLGITLKYAFWIAGIMIIFWSSYFWWAAHRDIKNAELILSAAPVVEQTLLHQIDADRNGFLFLEFKRPKGTLVENFTEFNVIDEETIRIYLGRK